MRDVAYVALGSNLGDRHAHLRSARDRIRQLDRTRILAASAVEETSPLGPVPQGAYLNQMLALETELAPAELLDALHAIEQDAGRDRSVRWGPRTLDLDIVLFARQQVCEPQLCVPHPELPNREFWARQLAELGATP
jgi:2-amino-4-hydroxy-6-hydroxymethyldihydropteridine diphosphokinase